jgi:hypothetical protein
VATPTYKKINKALSAGENFAHPLYQLIGAPLLALVQAERQAAQATAEFIENIGFERAPTVASENASEAEKGDSLGKLKMATFTNQMKGPNGELKEMKVQVPLLSLLPIPALQIKDAELEFYVKILDFSKEQSLGKMQESFSKDTIVNPDNDSDAVKPAPNERIQLRAAMGRGPTTNQSSMESQVRIKINMTQADVPAGLSKLFHIMEQSIAVIEQGKEDE